MLYFSYSWSIFAPSFEAAPPIHLNNFWTSAWEKSSWSPLLLCLASFHVGTLNIVIFLEGVRNFYIIYIWDVNKTYSNINFYGHYIDKIKQNQDFDQTNRKNNVPESKQLRLYFSHFKIKPPVIIFFLLIPFQVWKFDSRKNKHLMC